MRANRPRSDSKGGIPSITGSKVLYLQEPNIKNVKGNTMKYYCNLPMPKSLIGDLFKGSVLSRMRPSLRGSQNANFTLFEKVISSLANFGGQCSFLTLNDL